MAPLPASANSRSPPAHEPATPSAFAIRSALRPISRPAATAAPNGPVVPTMEAARLIGVLGGMADPEHDFAAGDKSGEKVASRKAAFLGDREGRGENGCARMRAGVLL